MKHVLHNLTCIFIGTLYEMPTVYSRRVDIDAQSFMSPEVHQIDRQLHEPWQLNDLRKHRASESTASSIGKITGVSFVSFIGEICIFLHYNTSFYLIEIVKYINFLIKSIQNICTKK